MLIIWESSLGAFMLSASIQFYLVITRCISFIFCTCWVPTISVLNLAIFPCYSNLLLRRRRWTGILRRRVLVLCCLSWCYCVMESSAVPFHKRVVLVFRDIIYVISILYSWHLAICEHFWSVCGTNDPRMGKFWDGKIRLNSPSK
jgi:hypothetical protein